MCKFIEESNVMPGWGCCRCKTYNGLQRIQCQRCTLRRHHITVPDHVKICPDCGWGYTGEMSKFQTLPDRMAGRKGTGACPCCAVIEKELATLKEKGNA